MRTTQANPQERTARELLSQSPPLFLGTADDVAVYWDSYERTFAVVDRDGNVATVPLAETPFQTPREYCDHIQAERGWDVGPHIGGSIVDDLVEALA